MFIDVKALTKLMKEAYKSRGLVMGCADEELIISGGHWAISLDSEHIPFSVKAAVVEYCGFVPEHEEGLFQVSKDMPDLQYKVPLGDMTIKILLAYRNANMKLIETPVLLEEGDGLRILQAAVDRSIHGINQKYLNMIDPSIVEYGVESTTTGPCFGENIGEGIFWYNDFCKVVIMPYKIKNFKIAEALTKVEFQAPEANV